MIRHIEKMGRLKFSGIITLASLVLSQMITMTVYGLTEGSISVSGRIASVASPLLITPFLAWWFLGLLLRISRLEKEMRILATFDKLTGAYNRNAFFPICESILNLSKRDKTPLTLLYIDIDHFKRINDSFGHDIGDQVLKSVGNLILNNIRKSDLLGRVGGEEFVVMLPHTNLEFGTGIAEKIRKGISDLEMAFDGEMITRLTVSIGVASNTYPESLGIDELIKLADRALYQAKNEGRNRLFVHQECAGTNSRLSTTVFTG